MLRDIHLKTGLFAPQSCPCDNAPAWHVLTLASDEFTFNLTVGIPKDLSGTGGFSCLGVTDLNQGQDVLRWAIFRVVRLMAFAIAFQDQLWGHCSDASST